MIHWKPPPRKVRRHDFKHHDAECKKQEEKARIRAVLLADQLGTTASSSFYAPSDFRAAMRRPSPSRKPAASLPSDDPITNLLEQEPPICATPARQWVIDTGSGFHLIGRDDLSPQELGNLRTNDRPSPLLTANGETTAKHVYDLIVKALGLENDTALVLEKSPSVLSLGRLCLEHGCSFWWQTGHNPQILLKDGSAIELDVNNYVPVLASPARSVTPSVPAAVLQLKTSVCPAQGPAGSSIDPIPQHIPPRSHMTGTRRVYRGGCDGITPRDSHALTHAIKDNSCPICKQGKIQNKAARRKVPQHRDKEDDDETLDDARTHK